MSLWWPATFFLGLICLATYRPGAWVAYHSALSREAKPGFMDNSTSNPFADLNPSESLDYHACYEGLQCARLKVPMSWKAGGEGQGESVAIAVLRRPAKVEITDPRYGGAIFVNPGGPAGSGVRYALTQGKEIQNITDASEDDGTGLFFDIIGFDPRGVGYTTPKLECFPDYLSRQYWIIQSTAGEAIAATNATLARKLAHATAVTKSCVDRAAHHNATIAYHMNSVPVTEDMVALVERHGEWREKTAISLLTSARGELRRRGTFTPEALSPEVTIALQRTKWKVGKEKLLYWGTSYGTVLGQLFAHLHPERVSRVLLDAVVDTDVYLNSKWDAHLEQADDVLEFFFDLCSRSSACAFREGDAKTTRDRFNKLLESLTKEPVSVASSRKPLISADSITSSDLMRLVRDAIYYPLRMFSYLDSILVDLERGNGTTLAARKQSDFSSHEQPQERCGSDTAFSPECHNPAEIEIEAVASIMCSDNRVIDSMSDQGFFAYMETLQTRSHYMGWYWAECQMLCRAWSVKSRWHVDGPLHANTAEPILFVGNSVDPVTPLRSAMKASKQFPGSGVLHQDSVGHTLLSSPSLCTAKKVRAYFQHGSLPSPSVKCEVDMLPFSGEVSIKDVEGSLSSSDKTLLMDLRRLVSRHDGLYH